MRGCDAGSRYNYRGRLFAFQRAKKVGGTAVGNNQWKVEDFAVVKVLLKKVTTYFINRSTQQKLPYPLEDLLGLSVWSWTHLKIDTVEENRQRLSSSKLRLALSTYAVYQIWNFWLESD